jgi:hypothetical protein
MKYDDETQQGFISIDWMKKHDFERNINFYLGFRNRNQIQLFTICFGSQKRMLIAQQTEFPVTTRESVSMIPISITGRLRFQFQNDYYNGYNIPEMTRQIVLVR